MKFRLLFILPTFLAFFAQAQTTGKLSGWVIDKNTQKPIAGVNVKLINTNFGTVTDSLGKYQFKSIPTGQYQVSFTSLGTLPYILFNVVITVGNETNKRCKQACNKNCYGCAVIAHLCVLEFKGVFTNCCCNKWRSC